jgi:flagellar biosynthesis/type III secretory pathway chaperone
MSASLDKAAQSLVGVLERENEALRAMDLARAAMLLPEKSAAIAILEEAGRLPGGSELPSFISTARRLNDLARENRHLLGRAIVAQQRLIGIVAQAASAARTERSAYGAGGCTTIATRPVAMSTRA